MLLTLLCVVLALAPASAVAASSNGASTHAFILANYAFVRTSDARVSVMTRKTRERMKALLKECRGAANGEPQDEQAYKLGYEAAGALWSSSYRADAGPIAKLVRATARLRWSNAKTAAEVKRYVSSLQGLAKLPLPPVCADIVSWKESGFQSLPARTLRFDAMLETLEATPVPSRLLTPYEQPGDAPLLKRTKEIETKLLNVETLTGGNDWFRLVEGLGLNT
jgi:hypothetical protein